MGDDDSEITPHYIRYPGIIIRLYDLLRLFAKVTNKEPDEKLNVGLGERNIRIYLKDPPSPAIAEQFPKVPLRRRSFRRQGSTGIKNCLNIYMAFIYLPL